jgi:hypothetical protein
VKTKGGTSTKKYKGQKSAEKSTYGTKMQKCKKRGLKRPRERETARESTKAKELLYPREREAKRVESRQNTRGSFFIDQKRACFLLLDLELTVSARFVVFDQQVTGARAKKTATSGV